MVTLTVLLAAVAAGLLVSPVTAPGTSRGRPLESAPSVAAPARSLHALAALGAGAAVLFVIPGVVGVVGASLTGALVWRSSRSWQSASERRRTAALQAELPFVVDLMGAALTAGADPSAALRDVADAVGGPTARELAQWRARLDLGADPVNVWSEMAAHPVFGRLGLSLRRAADSGAPVVPALARLAEDLRSRRRAEVESRVRQVEVKAAVPLGVCLLPAFVLVGVVPLVAGAVIGLLLGR